MLSWVTMTTHWCITKVYFNKFRNFWLLSKSLHVDRNGNRYLLHRHFCYYKKVLVRDILFEILQVKKKIFSVILFDKLLMIMYYYYCKYIIVTYRISFAFCLNHDYLFSIICNFLQITSQLKSLYKYESPLWPNNYKRVILNHIPLSPSCVVDVSCQWIQIIAGTSFDTISFSSRLH